MSTHTISLSTGQQIPCRDDQTLLDAALRQGVWLPNSCNQGTCGSCTINVLEGKVDHRDSPHVTLSPTDRTQGLALGCQATPCGDVTIESQRVGNGDQKVHALRDFTAHVVDMKDVATDTRSLTLRLSEPMAFTPGQYVEINVPGTPEHRHYSVASVPGPDGTSEEIELHIKRQPGGLASCRWIFDSMIQGEQIALRGPLGDFHADTQSEGGVIMIAGGTGLAPILSILQTLLSSTPEREIHLYQSARIRDELYALELLEDLSDDHRNFHLKPCLTRELWEGRTGYATEMIVEDFPTLRGWSGYLCGPPALVDAGRRAFKRRRMSPRQIRWEKYLAADSDLVLTR